MENVLTVEEVAESLKITPVVVRELLRQGKLRGSKIGKNWRVKESDLEAYFETQANRPTSARD